MVKQTEKKVKRKNKSLKAVLLDKKNFPLLIVSLCLVVAFLFFGVTMVNQNSDISRLKRQRDEISAKVDDRVQENKELQAVLDNENKDDYIEQKAREKGYVKSNEIVFYDISAGE